MKKFIAFFVVAILFAANAYASDPTPGVQTGGKQWLSGPQTAEFHAWIVCTPTLTVTNGGPHNLGNFFANSGPTGWDLATPVAVSIFVNGPTVSGAADPTTGAGTGSDPITYDVTYIVSGDGGTETGLTPAEVSAFLAAQSNNNEKWYAEGDETTYLLGAWSVIGTFGCETANQGVTASYTAQKIVTGAILGEKVFSVDVAMTVNI